MKRTYVFVVAAAQRLLVGLAACTSTHDGDRAAVKADEGSNISSNGSETQKPRGVVVFLNLRTIHQLSYPTTKDRFTYSGRTLAALDVAGVALAISGKSEGDEGCNGEDTSEHF
jgi:hypothetical protein